MTHRKVVLTTAEVAKIEGVSVAQVAYWCKNDQIFQCQRVGRNWVIHYNYIRTAQRMPGRVKGAKNLKPYPIGVKRPRKPKVDSGPTPTVFS